jgi:hypothetical protein
VFLGVTGVADDEIMLTGNDFKKGTSPVQKGAVHLHLP